MRLRFLRCPTKEEKDAFVLIYLKMMLDLLVVIQFGHCIIKFLLYLSIC